MWRMSMLVLRSPRSADRVVEGYKREAVVSDDGRGIGDAHRAVVAERDLRTPRVAGVLLRESGGSVAKRQGVRGHGTGGTPEGGESPCRHRDHVARSVGGHRATHVVAPVVGERDSLLVHLGGA